MESIINELKQLQEQFSEGLISDQELKDHMIILINGISGANIFELNNYIINRWEQE
jgi:hypothetical protein